jgi:hypothetical protein
MSKHNDDMNAAFNSFNEIFGEAVKEDFQAKHDRYKNKGEQTEQSKTEQFSNDFAKKFDENLQSQQEYQERVAAKQTSDK